MHDPSYWQVSFLSNLLNFSLFLEGIIHRFPNFLASNYLAWAPTPNPVATCPSFLSTAPNLSPSFCALCSFHVLLLCTILHCTSLNNIRVYCALYLLYFVVVRSTVVYTAKLDFPFVPLSSEVWNVYSTQICTVVWCTLINRYNLFK